MKLTLATIFSVIFLLLFTLNSNAHIRHRGEWESSGDLIFAQQQQPTPPVNYNCTIEVSVSEGSKSLTARMVHRFRTGDFAKTGTAEYVTTSEEDWTTYNDQDLAVAYQLEHELKGQKIMLSFSLSPEQKEVVSLFVTNALTERGLTSSTSNSDSADRSAGTIRARTMVNMAGAHTQAVNILEVICQSMEPGKP